MTRDCCSECGCAGDDKIEGIAEGLRMAAEMLHNSKVRNDFYQQIISKAKEIEESAGKGEK